MSCRGYRNLGFLCAIGETEHEIVVAHRATQSQLVLFSAVALWVPDVLLGPYPWILFVFLSVSLVSAKKKTFAKTPLSWFLTLRTWRDFVCSKSSGHLVESNSSTRSSGFAWQRKIGKRIYTPMLSEELPRKHLEGSLEGSLSLWCMYVCIYVCQRPHLVGRF